jgi:hypothetical protein
VPGEGGDSLRQFMRELLLRHERVTDRLISAMERRSAAMEAHLLAMRDEMLAMRDEIRSNTEQTRASTQAVLLLLDRLGPSDSPA